MQYLVLREALHDPYDVGTERLVDFFVKPMGFTSAQQSLSKGDEVLACIFPLSTIYTSTGHISTHRGAYLRITEHLQRFIDLKRARRFR